MMIFALIIDENIKENEMLYVNDNDIFDENESKFIFKNVTSSNFFVISENALKIAFVDPETVTIRSGHDPSDMLIFAPD